VAAWGAHSGGIAKPAAAGVTGWGSGISGIWLMPARYAGSRPCVGHVADGEPEMISKRANRTPGR
jgi:hypothetical protein